MNDYDASTNDDGTRFRRLLIRWEKKKEQIEGWSSGDRRNIAAKSLREPHAVPQPVPVDHVVASHPMASHARPVPERFVPRAPELEDPPCEPSFQREAG